MDKDTQEEMCELLWRICREVRITTLHVTHSMSEAPKLADCLFRVEDGQVRSLRPGEEA